MKEIKVGDVLLLNNTGVKHVVLAVNVKVPMMNEDGDATSIEDAVVCHNTANGNNIVVLVKTLEEIAKHTNINDTSSVYSVSGLRQAIQSYVDAGGDDVKVVGGGLLELFLDIPEVYYEQMPVLAEAIMETNRIFREESDFPVDEYVLRPWNSPAITGIWHSVRNHLITTKNVDVGEIVSELPKVMSNNPKIRPYSNDF